MRNTLLFLTIISLSFQITSAQKPELWGITSQGGVQDYGTIFKINGDGTGFWKMHDFTVENPGISPRNMTPLEYQGWLYGVTEDGGSGNGVLFKYHPGENRYIPVHFFSNDEGSFPSGSLMLASNGKMYGVLQNGATWMGTLYEFDPLTGQVLVKFNFTSSTGISPAGKLVERAGYLYGVTQTSLYPYQGSLYRFNISTATYELLHNFSFAEGADLNCDLLLASDGKFYGKARYGGNNYNGTLFSFDPSNNSFVVVHHFNNISDGYYPEGNLIEYATGKITGTASYGGTYDGGTIFTYDYTTAQFEINYYFGAAGNQLNRPAPFIMQSDDGWIYGSTTYYNYSTILPSVFRFYPDSIAPQQLAKFTSGVFTVNSAVPLSGLVQYSDGWLYGATANGGGSSLTGSLYRFNPNGFELEKLIALNETQCVHPFGSLTVSQNGKLYGIGGQYNYYISEVYSVNHPLSSFSQYCMFEMNPLNGSFKRVAPDLPNSFGTGGINSLTAATDQNVYGISTNEGGKVFRYDPVNDTSAVFLTVSKFDIGTVYGDLIQTANGKLYGLSTNGGYLSTNMSGIIFKIDPVNKTFKSVFDFEEDVTGNAPKGSLLEASDGLLYGMTKNLGLISDIVGTIFSYDIAEDTFKLLYQFTDTLNGKYPLGNLIEGTNGLLYGMTPQGGNFGYGVIFSFNKLTNQFTKLWDFDGELAGGSPQGSLTQASNGEFYGMTLRGGLNDKGVIFAFDPDLLLYEVIENFTVNEKGALPYGNLVEYHGPASMIYTMPDTAACLGSDFTLLAIATGGYLYHTWYHDGVLVGGNAKGLQINPVTYADTGKYWCVIHNDLGTVVSDTIHLQVVESQIASLSIIGNDLLCPYDPPVELVGAPSGGFYSGTGVNGVYFDPALSGSGTFQVYYTYSYGCSSVDSVSVTVNELPQVEFTYPNDTLLCLDGASLPLEASPAGGSFSGDGISGNIFNPSNAGMGTHLIYYTYTDNCTASSFISITVDICEGIEVVSTADFKTEPNPFSEMMKVIIPEEMRKAGSHFRLINHLGNTVEEGEISFSEFFISRNHLASGMYFLVIESEEIVIAKKIVIE